ncbi:MAG TPA: transcription elongation factor GreA [Candidatus Saccharimonadales bacterium]
MIKKDYQLTLDGKNELEEELRELKGRRGEIADKIATARDFGDLSENSEYSAAKDEQSQVESRISEIEGILQNATIIKTKSNSIVHLGNTVTLKTDGKTVVYTIVGSVEADPLEGKVSDESPIGQALLGKKMGDKVAITTPRGDIFYEIVSIS